MGYKRRELCLTFTFLVAGCAWTADVKECKSNSGCDYGTRCVEGVCVTGCDEDVDCGHEDSGYRCGDDNSCYGWEDPNTGLIWSLDLCDNDSNAYFGYQYYGDYCVDIDTPMYGGWSCHDGDVWDFLQSEYCYSQMTEGGYSDWRIPTISELRSLIRGCHYTQTGGDCPITDECFTEECLTGVLDYDYCLDDQCGLDEDDSCLWPTELKNPEVEVKIGDDYRKERLCHYRFVSRNMKVVSFFQGSIWSMEQANSHYAVRLVRGPNEQN